MRARNLFAADAGGSGTRVLVAPADGGQHTLALESINPNAAGPAADETLMGLFAAVRDLLGGQRAVGWLASASVDPQRVDGELDRIRLAAVRARQPSVLMVSNDVLPLLWGVPALSGEGVVAVAGTGSGFLGADRTGRIVRAGGCEYLGSDEGSATDIGLRGLRAAVRASDGRGPVTALADAFAAALSYAPGELARRLAAQPFPKRGLAQLAPTVCATWLDGDEVARWIIQDAVADLVAGVRAVRDQLSLPPGFAVATAGGVVAGCREFHRELARQLKADLGAGCVELVTDTAATVLTGLTALLGHGHRPSLPLAFADRHAWVFDT